jgi:hypothetical protein
LHRLQWQSPCFPQELASQQPRFTDKKLKYFSANAGVSNFALTSKVLAESAWTLDTLKRRQAELIGAIEKLWRLA